MAFLTRSGKPTPTNIILIMRDAQEYGDFGFTVNPAIATPNLDRLVANSVQMDNFYIHPVRAPTRACLLTGRYNYRCRVTDTWVGRAKIYFCNYLGLYLKILGGLFPISIVIQSSDPDEVSDTIYGYYHRIILGFQVRLQAINPSQYSSNAQRSTFLCSST